MSGVYDMPSNGSRFTQPTPALRSTSKWVGVHTQPTCCTGTVALMTCESTRRSGPALGGNMWPEDFLYWGIVKSGC